MVSIRGARVLDYRGDIEVGFAYENCFWVHSYILIISSGIVGGLFLV